MKTILLDMDGVLANFMGGVSEVFDRDVQNYHSWDVHKVFGITAQEFWWRIHNHDFFWLNLEVYAWANHLINLCKTYTDNVYICSSPATHPLCYKEKYEWIEDNLPGFKNRLILTNNKHLLSNSNTILIDDSNVNCKQFYQHGGKYILFPQTWNINDTYIIERMAYVKRKLNELI